MIKFTHYYYREDNSPKILLSIDWFSFEDHWFQRYMFDRPMWNEEDMERLKETNLNRHKWFTIRLNLMNFHVSIDFRGKKVGNLYYGRQMDDSPKPSPLRRKKQP